MNHSVNAFNRRLDKIQASLPRQDTAFFEWNYELFTPVEQAELQLFMESFPPDFQQTNRLSGERLSQLGCWCYLEQALRNGNTAEAEKWRRRRAISLEQLVDRFLHLDISSLPENPNVPGPKVTESNCTLSLTRTNYRHLCWCVQRRPMAYRDDMWRWTEYFESL